MQRQVSESAVELNKEATIYLSIVYEVQDSCNVLQAVGNMHKIRNYLTDTNITYYVLPSWSALICSWVFSKEI